MRTSQPSKDTPIDICTCVFIHTQTLFHTHTYAHRLLSPFSAVCVSVRLGLGLGNLSGVWFFYLSAVIVCLWIFI